MKTPAFSPTLLRAVLLLGCMLQYAASQGSQSNHPSPQLPHVAFLSLPLPAWLSLPPAIPRAEPSCWRSCTLPQAQMQTTSVLSNHQWLFPMVFRSAGVAQPARWPLQVHYDTPGVRHTGCLIHFTDPCHTHCPYCAHKTPG